MCTPKPATYLEDMDRMPPYLCWVLARRNKRPISQQEIAEKTGWGHKKVERFCGLTSWKGVTVEDVDLWRSSCGINRHNERRHRYYLKRALDISKTVNGLAHVRKRTRIAQNRIISIIQKQADASGGEPA